MKRKSIVRLTALLLCAALGLALAACGAEEKAGSDEPDTDPAPTAAVTAPADTAPTKAPEKTADPIPAQPTVFDVIITQGSGALVADIQTLRALSDLGMGDAKKLLDALPAAFATGLPKADAEALVKKLGEGGITAELRASLEQTSAGRTTQADLNDFTTWFTAELPADWKMEITGEGSS